MKMQMFCGGSGPCAVGLGLTLAASACWGAAQKETLERPATVDFAQTPLKDVLDFFAKDFGLNFAWASRASDEMPLVTAKMKGVPARTALEAIASAAGLACEFVGDNVAVLTVKGKQEPPGHRVKPRKGPLFVHGFEQGLDGWHAPRGRIGNIEIDGQVMKTDREEDVKVGQCSLEWRYEYAPDRVSAILRRTRLDAAVNELRFWLKTEGAPVAVLVGLKERDGSEYEVVVQLDREGQWTLHKLRPSEFSLGDDSEDENDTLDLDQVREISLVDVTGLLQQAAGENAIWLDDFTVE